LVAIAEKSSTTKTATFFEQRATLGTAAAAQAAWDKVGSGAAVAEDTLSQ
jgi:hypothetical protein